MLAKTAGISGVTAAMLILAGAAAVVPATMRAQDVKDTRRDSPAAFSMVFFSAGSMHMDVSRLNEHFARTDLDPRSRPGFFALSNDGYSVGIGGYGVVYDRLLLGAEYNGADMGSESSPMGKTNQLTTSYAMGTVGYALWTTWKLNIAPFVGVGAGTAKLTLQSQGGSPGGNPLPDPTFDEIVASPGLESTVQGRYVIVQPGIALDYLFLQSSASTRGLTIGLRLASAISPNRTTWKYRGHGVYGGPDAGPTGGTIRIVVGYGGFRLLGAR